MGVRQDNVQVTDENGELTELIRIIPMIPIEDLSGHHGFREGLAQVLTKDGKKVNALGGGHYAEVISGKKYRATHPSG